jgi:hypothetical protein
MPGVLDMSDIKFNLHADRLHLTISGDWCIPDVGGDIIKALPNELQYSIALPKP